MLREKERGMVEQVQKWRTLNAREFVLNFATLLLIVFVRLSMFYLICKSSWIFLLRSHKRNNVSQQGAWSAQVSIKY